MLEKMLNIAKAQQELRGVMVRFDCQYNTISCDWSARAWYFGGKFIDIKLIEGQVSIVEY